MTVLVVVLVFAAVLPVAVFVSFVFRSIRRERREGGETVRMREELLRSSIDWDVAESIAGRPIPEAVRDFYNDPSLTLRTSVEIRADGRLWHIEYFNPLGMALETGRDRKRLDIATDECGNQYSVSLTLPVSPVWHRDHDTGDEVIVAASLDGFKQLVCASGHKPPR